MPRQRLPVAKRRRQLLELGAQLFSHHAYDALSTDEIARRAGVSKGLLYHYFPSKRGFYVATIAAMAEHVTRVTELASGGDVGEAVEGALARFVDFVADNAALYRGLMRGGIGADREVEAIVEGVRQTTVTRIAMRMGAVPRQSAAIDPMLHTALYGWVGFVEAASLSWVERERDLTQAQLVRLMLSALAPAVALGRGGDR